MKFLSVCSGIEAASCAWEPFGFKPVAFSEIEPFPCSVLAHRFPSVPNLGDMTQFEEWDIEPGSVDILVGGTPCQSFSVAGLRGGLEDDRGNLALIYCRILQKFQPRWFVWENVPGVLSSNGGRDFGSILGAMVELGYGIAYRILDAQYFGVPQRRRRVFVVGCAGDWRRAAEVLFEPGCVSGNPKKSGKARKDVAGSLASRTSAGGGLGTDFDLDGGLQVASFHTTGAGWWNEGCGTLRGRSQDSHENVVAYQCHGTNIGPMGTLRKGDGNVQSGVPLIAGTLGANHGNIRAEHAWTNQLIPSTGRLSHCLNAGGMGRQHYETETLIASAYRTAGDGAVYDEGDKVAPLTTSTDPNANVIAFSGRDRGDDGRGYDREPNVTGSITETIDSTKPPRVAGPTTGVRRLTPRECERLQGFPDDWTLVPHRGKPAADGPRYKAIGNSMAVPVMRWIGKRIQEQHR